MTTQDLVRIQRPKKPTAATVRVPGDKSISHRAVMFAAAVEGQSTIRGALTGGDVGRTLALAQAMGARINPRGEDLVVEGTASSDPVSVDCGRSGTTLRLATGLLVGQRRAARLSADRQLLRRPMDRITEPLGILGGRAVWGPEGMAVTASDTLQGGHITPSVASAQVKGALLLAGAFGGVDVTVNEPRPTRDHTERLLRAMGARVSTVKSEVRLVAGGALSAVDMVVPGDPSSAAALATAATLCAGASLRLPEVSDNPGRRLFFEVLSRMARNVQRSDEGHDVEPRVTFSIAGAEALAPVDIGPADVPGLIDELMLVALLACAADGTSTLRGVSELRVKESDRLSEMVRVLRAFGGELSVDGDDVTIRGPRDFVGQDIDAGRDHRVAMLAVLAGLRASGVTTVHGAGYIADSFPGFFDLFEQWGARC